MRAVTTMQYGGPETLAVTDQPDPKVGPDSVLIQVHAASINPVDYKVLRGYLDGAFPTVFPLITGWDVAGTVAAVGPAVTDFEAGQPVMAYARKDYIGHGTWAELVAVPLRAVAPSPNGLDPVQASCLPLAGLTAWQALTEKLEVAAGQTLLVHAASGGVGSFAVQLGVARGARVIGTASEGNHDYLRGLGAEPVAYGDGLPDRVRALAPDGVDAVLDLVGGDALEVSPELLRSGGRLASVIDAARVKELGGHYVFVRPDAGQLRELAGLVEVGRLRVEVQETFGLSDVRRAVELAEAGHVRGKLVLTV